MLTSVSNLLLPLVGQTNFQFVVKNGYITGPYILWALKALMSLPLLTMVGTPIASTAFFALTHHASATASMSPHGFRGSPQRPVKYYEIKKLQHHVYYALSRMFQRRIRKYDIKGVKSAIQISLTELSWPHEGVARIFTDMQQMIVIVRFLGNFSSNLMKYPYSRVTTFLGFLLSKTASTQGFWVPITRMVFPATSTQSAACSYQKNDNESIITDFEFDLIVT